MLPAHSQGSSHIDLPPEIWSIVLHHLHVAGVDNVVSATRTSRRLREEAERYLYREVCFLFILPRDWEEESKSKFKENQFEFKLRQFKEFARTIKNCARRASAVKHLSLMFWASKAWADELDEDNVARILDDFARDVVDLLDFSFVRPEGPYNAWALRTLHVSCDLVGPLNRAATEKGRTNLNACDTVETFAISFETPRRWWQPAESEQWELCRLIVPRGGGRRGSP